MPGVPDKDAPEYVPRDVDAAEFGVQAKVGAAAQKGGFVLLVEGRGREGGRGGGGGGGGGERGGRRGGGGEEGGGERKGRGGGRRGEGRERRKGEGEGGERGGEGGRRGEERGEGRGSSVGKTRCAAEAVKSLLPDWWLVHPASPVEVITLAQAPPPRTVVWLDELQRYLDGEHGLTGGVVRALLTASHPAVITGTLWSDWYTAYTTLPEPDGADPYVRKREVLKLAHVI